MQNNPKLKGQLAAPKELFGDFSRYAIAPVHTRFDAVQWFVWDAEHPDCTENQRTVVIRQEDTKAQAMAGLIGF